jgi:1-acyl-sn-glycerol-3-phosphate acyltransferase
MVPLFYWSLTIFVHYFVLPLYGRVSVTGVENLPREGPIIIAVNHLNDADPGIVATRIPRRLVFMAKAELFRVPVLSQLLRLYGAFPVRRNEADLSALRRSNEALNQGLALVLFPEGRRSGERARLVEAWPGTALIALRNKVPIVPCALTGSQHMGMPGMFLRVFRRYRITLTIGEPFFLPTPERVNTELAVAGTKVIMEKIAALLPEDYRGYYGDGRLQVEAAALGSEPKG